MKQTNFALIFSLEKKIHVMIKAFPDSAHDIISFKQIIKEINLTKHIIILDSGFSSYYLPDMLTENKIKFILPSRRNFLIIYYNLNLKNRFVYRKKKMHCARMKV